MFSLNTLLAGM